MSIAELMPNLCAYMLQSSALLLVGLLLPKLVRLRKPNTLLLYYRFLFPMVVFFPIPIFIPIVILAVVSLLRLGWVSMGLASLGRLCSKAKPLRDTGLVRALQAWVGCRATFLLSDGIVGPATFGWAKPTILLPEDFVSLPGAQQRAVVCHELLHVKRKDWPFGLIEELVRDGLPIASRVRGRIQFVCREKIPGSRLPRKCRDRSNAPNYMAFWSSKFRG